MTTCYRFDRDPVTNMCRTCGREVVFYPSTRRNVFQGTDGSWQHVGPTIGAKLAELNERRKGTA